MTTAYVERPAIELAHSMHKACYRHAMSAIQVKNVTPELHSKLRQRARAEGRSMSEYVLDVLERDLALPTMREWLAELGRDEPVSGISSQRIVEIVGHSREERDAQIQRAISHRD
jgi:plasmid stability protein